jgi:hypothetical protein
MAQEGIESFKNNLTKPANIPVLLETSEVRNTSAQESPTTGGLLSNLKIDTQGNVIGVPNNDWNSYPKGSFVYGSSTTVSVSGLSISDLFQVGDKIRLVQGGNTKYFYIVLISGSTLTLSGGDDYVLANELITEFSSSRLGTPSGFPTKFNYTATILNGTFQNQSLKFSISGNIVQITGGCSIITSTSGTPSVRISYPFNLRNTTIANQITVLQYAENSPQPASGKDFGDYIARVSAGDGSTTQVYFYTQRADGSAYDANFGSGSLLNPEYTFEYVY